MRVIDHNLLAPLRQDARISETILLQVRKIFLALPANIQARVLLTGIRHVIERDRTFGVATPPSAAAPATATATATTAAAAVAVAVAVGGAAATAVDGTPLPTAKQRDSAELAKKLLSAGGVVAVKLAQMLAEDPKIPHE